MADAKTLVFVHGSDPAQANTPWMFFHLDPTSYPRPLRSEGKTFDLVYFDFETGERRTWNGWSATRSKSPPTAAPDSVVALTPKVKIRDSLGNAYSGSPDLPSVLAFYNWVKSEPKGSIASIQVFSHAVIYQPVLFAASYEWGSEPDKRTDPSAERDPNDTEFRLRDFEGTNPLSSDPWAGGMSGELAKFRAALADDAFIKVWGCGEQTLTGHGDPIRKIVADYVATPSGKAGDARRASLVLAYLDHVRGFFPFRLAEQLDLPVWAGPVGWGSDPYEVDGSYDPKTFARDRYRWSGMFPPDLDRKELWWRVSINFRKNRAIASKLFRGALKCRLDQMGYVEYRRSWVNAATDAANSVLNPTSGSPAGTFLDAPRQIFDGLLDRIAGLGRLPEQTENEP